MNTRKINELPVLQQATAETNVLVEQNGTASRIPASALGGGGGSEKALIDKLAPAFKKTGAVVTCNPVEGHPLEVVSHIKPGVIEIPLDEWTDEHTGDPAVLVTDAPAGEYTLQARSEMTGAIVAAYDVETGEQTIIGELEYGEQDDFGFADGTFTFNHEGGSLLIRNDSWGILKLSNSPLRSTSSHRSA